MTDVSSACFLFVFPQDRKGIIRAATKTNLSLVVSHADADRAQADRACWQRAAPAITTAS